MAERLLPTADTLVKYDNAVLVTKHDDEEDEEEATAAPPASHPLRSDAKRETEDILNFILPPKQWEEDDKLWRQHVSTTPATRLDVINLQEQLDMKLQQQQARETGICPIRRELYTQCFDELIRQITINCAERGLLLLRIRDELRMTIEAFQALYCSGVAFGIRKALQSEQNKSDLTETVEELNKDKVQLEQEIIELKQKAEQAERRAAEIQSAEKRRYTEEINFLTKTNQQLKAQLEGIIAPKK